MKRKCLILSMLTAIGMPLAAQALPTDGAASAPGFPRKVSQTVPYFEDFSNQSSFSSFLVVDNNKDGATWAWYKDENPYARCSSHATNSTDDWLLTPTIRLEENHTYIFSFKYWRGFYAETIAVGFGQGDDPSTYEVIHAGLEIPDTDDNIFTQEVTAKATGDFRFGIHGITSNENRRFYIAIDDISIKEGSKTAAPDSVTNFSVKAGEKGQRNAEVSLHTPVLDAAGNTLTALSKVELLRNDTLVHTFDSPAPGTDLTINLPGGKDGMNVFTAIAHNDKGAGRKKSMEIYIGIDTPMPPTNVRLIDNGKSYTAVWDEVSTVGVHNGYVDPSQVTYTVYNVVEEEIANDINETNFINDDATPYAVTGVTQYFVSATNKAGKSEKQPSNYLCTGKPARLPFVDSFAKGRVAQENLWWWQFEKQKNWRCTTAMAYDADGGCLNFAADEPGDEGWISTGKLAIQNVPAPHITFAYYATPGVNNKFEVIASKMQNEDVVIATIDFSTLTGERGWRKTIIPIEGMSKSEFMVLRLHAIVNDVKEPVIVDAIDLKDRKSIDLATSIFAPEAAKVNKPAPFNIKVSNEGTKSVSDYQVELYCNNNLVEKQTGKTINPTEEQIYTFNYVANVNDAEELYFRAVVNCTSDEYNGNNASYTDPIMVVKNDHFDNAKLSGSETNSDVVLTWNAIEQETVKTETFESYKPWSINYIGGWNVYDVDKAYTYGIKGIVFPHYADPMAYIVFNPEAAEVDLEENPMIAPHNGSQFLGCFAADPESAPAGHNDDWFVSPLLNGKAQTVKIWAKSLFADAGDGVSLKEHFEVMGSKSNNEVADFTERIADFDNIPDQWTEYTVNVPEGTKYFAIHTISADKFLLMLDDITYEPQPMTIKGFNIYRDGTFLAFVPAGTFDYTDKGSAGEAHKYQLTTVYEEGESSLSNVYATATGIDEQASAEASIRGGEGCIVINGITGENISVVNHDGITFFKGIAEQTTTVSVPRGIYIVKTDRMVRKVVVK